MEAASQVGYTELLAFFNIASCLQDNSDFLFPSRSFEKEATIRRAAVIESREDGNDAKYSSHIAMKP